MRVAPTEAKLLGGEGTHGTTERTTRHVFTPTLHNPSTGMRTLNNSLIPPAVNNRPQYDFKNPYHPCLPSFLTV
jgi:hypothetical protein